MHLSTCSPSLTPLLTLTHPFPPSPSSHPSLPPPSSHPSPSPPSSHPSPPPPPTTSLSPVQLGIWDLRLKRKVRHFTEHVNDFRRCSVLLDSHESTLIAGDCYVGGEWCEEGRDGVRRGGCCEEGNGVRRGGMV